MHFALQNGSAQVRAGELMIRDRTGADVGRVPLSYRMENRQYPIAVRVVGRTVTLTPVRDISRSTALNPREVERVRVAARNQQGKPTTRQERDDQALSRFNQQLQAGMTISALVGLTIGAVVGGTLGCILGIAAAVIGCLVAVAPAAGLGGIVGTIVGGGGSVIVGGIQYFRTITSPFP
ncbi:glycine zipper family protein [Gordonia bronchialis]|uniref:glycine zipper family protein n=1 Tax=Gordonia bronchialis TaxID=2054 RepID=UPI00242F2DAC|nr:glycine zipper family protein [Gordonia bronchialis]